jgi:hypothetical protein
MQHLFGQNKNQQTKTSPNAALIRTEQAPTNKNQSECSTYSDRTSTNKQKPVRMQHLFGQNKHQQTKTSPNAALIRTEQAPKSKNQSESSTHSDRTSSQKQNPVRIEVSFGQNKLPKAKTSPNPALIRTQQTPKGKNQSECSTHSDRTSSNKQKPVRMQHSFGQNKHQQTKTSPNAALIRTEQAPKNIIQSECSTYSDRTSPKKQKPVRMQLLFGQNKLPKAAKSSPN